MTGKTKVVVETGLRQFDGPTASTVAPPASAASSPASARSGAGFSVEGLPSYHPP